MRLLRSFFQFLYDFLVGDSWQISLGVVGVILAARLLTLMMPHRTAALQPLFLLALIAVFSGVILNESRKPSS